ncbi:MAG: hypothetical protein H6711_16995 [Myxococcales bacterium]|nr:hypothetical protein [Myxococcales bacterium]
MLVSARRLAAPGLGALLLQGVACLGPAPGGSASEGSASASAGSASAATTAASEGTTSAGGSSGGASSESGGPLCPSGCLAGETCVADGVCACAREPEDSCPPELECGADGRCFGPVWPNRVSQVNSDPWISENHQAIRRMRPRVLALNFVNARSNAEMVADLEGAIAGLREGSRFHGHSDAAAPAFLEYAIAYAIDLRDDPPPPGWTYHNSTRYPREDPVEGYWGFDYERLFSAEFAGYYGIEDPEAPGEALGLCQLFQRGLIHEVWVYGDADVPDVGAAEVLELKPRYDAARERTKDPMSRCAGNGCFDEEDAVSCGVTVRIAWFNNTRGPGCFLESLSHGLESTGAGDPNLIPYLFDYFPTFAGLDLGKRYGVPFQSWYSCPYGQPCVDYPSATSAHYSLSADVEGTIDPFDPVCGNVHWPPNGRQHYDLSSPHEVMSSCVHYRDGSGESEPYTSSLHQAYSKLAPDCMGPFIVWWRQNMPGLDNGALDDEGQPMLNWWPFLFY